MKAIHTCLSKSVNLLLVYIQVVLVMWTPAWRIHWSSVALSCTSRIKPPNMFECQPNFYCLPNLREWGHDVMSYWHWTSCVPTKLSTEHRYAHTVMDKGFHAFCIWGKLVGWLQRFIPICFHERTRHTSPFKRELASFDLKAILPMYHMLTQKNDMIIWGGRRMNLYFLILKIGSTVLLLYIWTKEQCRDTSYSTSWKHRIISLGESHKLVEIMLGKEVLDDFHIASERNTICPLSLRAIGDIEKEVQIVILVKEFDLGWCMARTSWKTPMSY